VKTVFRYPLRLTGEPWLELPVGAQVLSVAAPRFGAEDHLDLWAAVDTSQPVESRDFRIVGTGNPMPDDCGRFLGTVPTQMGRFIWHVFEVI
jgi:hypothetical protein